VGEGEEGKVAEEERMEEMTGLEWRRGRLSV